MKNKLGQKLAIQDIKDAWADAKHLPGYDHQLDPLQDKAYTVYIERMREAEDRGASDEELAAINSRDVTLTVWDKVSWWLHSFAVVNFICGLYHWYVDEPDYSGIRPF